MADYTLYIKKNGKYYRLLSPSQQAAKLGVQPATLRSRRRTNIKKGEEIKNEIYIEHGIYTIDDNIN